MSFVPTTEDRLAMVRGRRVSDPALARLAAVGIGFEQVGLGTYHVAGTVMFWPATGYWRAFDNSAQGYSVDALINRVLPKVSA